MAILPHKFEYMYIIYSDAHYNLQSYHNQQCTQLPAVKGLWHTDINIYCLLQSNVPQYKKSNCRHGVRDASLPALPPSQT